GILVPHIKNELSASVTPRFDSNQVIAFSRRNGNPNSLPSLMPVTTDLFIPQPELDVADALKIRLGYEFANGCGGFAVSYPYLVSDGFDRVRGAASGFGVLDLLGRLDINVVDLSYVSPAFPLAGRGVFNWEIGARLGSIFFDNQLLLPVNQPQILDLHVSNHFFGAGPQAAVGLSQPLGSDRLALFGRVDGSILIGTVTQRYRINREFFIHEFGETDQHGTQAVPTLAVQAGFCWSPFLSGRVQLLAGYQWEQFWNVGDVNGSQADVWAQGAFIN